VRENLMHGIDGGRLDKLRRSLPPTLLKTMSKRLVLVRNLLGQEGVPGIVGEHLEMVNNLMTETLQALKEGDIR
jgi:hypothetical protein